MEARKFDFVINTSNTCFICFNEAFTPETFSLKRICQHLKIELSKTITVPPKLLAILNKIDIKVSLCKECGDLTESLSKLFEELEVIKLKIEFRFKELESKLKGSENFQGEIDYQTKLAVDTKALMHSGIVEKLRAEIITKCKPLLEKRLPIIKLERVVYSPPLPSLPPPEPDDNGLPDPCPSPDNLSQAVKEEIDLCDSPDEDDAPVVLQVEEFQDEDSKCDPLVDLLSPPGPAESPFSGSYQCRLCTYSFGSRGGLARHVTRTHGAKKPRNYECDVCHKRFFMPNHLTTHRHLHFGIKFKCPTCGRAFTQKAVLNRHMKNICGVMPVSKQMSTPIPTFCSTEGPPFICKFCGKYFPTDVGLGTHIGKVHGSTEDEKRFPCHICKKRFMTGGQLKVHIGIHFGVKHKCGFCNFTSTQQGPIYTHQLNGSCSGFDGKVEGRPRTILVEPQPGSSGTFPQEDVFDMNGMNILDQVII